MEIKHPPIKNGNCSCKECYKSMSKLDELDKEFDEKFVEGMNYIANGNKLGTVEAIKSFARKYYELGKAEGYKAREMFPIDAFQAGKLEEREGIKKKMEEYGKQVQITWGNKSPADIEDEFKSGCLYGLNQATKELLSTLNNEK